MRRRRENRISLMHQRRIRRVKGEAKLWEFHGKMKRRVIHTKGCKRLMGQVKGQK